MKVNYLGILLILLMILFAIKIFKDSDSFNLRCIISKVDGNTYCVRERSKVELAADLLAEATKKMKRLVEHMNLKHASNPAVKRLVENFNPNKISETLPTSEHTAYSENKGEKMAFCLNEDKEGTRLIDLSTLTFVAIHELAHLMTESIGHKEEFWDNFKFLLESAKKAGIYEPVDYAKSPVQYCGTRIDENPLYKQNKIKIDFFIHVSICDNVGKKNTMVWTMWQGWHDENQKNLRLERQLERLRTTLNRVVDERDKLREERDKLEEENKKLRKS